VASPVIRSSCAKAPDQFEPLCRSAKAFQAAPAVGVSYRALGDLVRSMATETSIVGDHIAGSHESELVGAFCQVLDEYKASLDAWKARIDAGAGPDHSVTGSWTEANEDVGKAVNLYLARH